MLRAVICLSLASAAASATVLPNLPAKRNGNVRLLALRGGNAPTPKQNYLAYANKGAATAGMEAPKALLASFHSGLQVGFGGLLAITVAAGVTGLDIVERRFVFGAVFPYIMFVILGSGGQLYTGNTASVTSAYLEGLIPLPKLWRALGLALAGNLAGCVAFAAIAKVAGIISPAAGELAATWAAKKISSPAGLVFLKAILCNWLVCLAILLTGLSQDVTGKILASYFPIAAFIILGLEHSVANACMLPIGLFGGAPISWGEIVTKNLVPVAVGNALGGAILVAASYSYIFGKLGDNES